MTTTLFAQAYDLAARGFYFETAEEYDTEANTLRNDYGDPVEEFEIQFIDGEQIDGELAKAIGINQANFREYLSGVDDWQDWEKQRIIVAVGECGYNFDPNSDPSDYNIDLYESESLRALAEQFVEEGLYGDIPETLQNYIDHDAIARDLAVEFSEITIAGERFAYASY
jgi:Antirestriction protein (ArdA)